MELQYVFSNPVKKGAKRSRKHKNKVHTRRKRSKIKKAGGNPVAKHKRKRKSRMRKGSPEAKAWGRKMKRLRAGEANPKRRRRRRKNPGQYIYSGEIPVTKSLKGKSRKFKTPRELEVQGALEMEMKALVDKLIDEHLAVPKDRRELLRQVGLGSDDISTLRQGVRELKKVAAQLRKEMRGAQSANEQKDKIMKLGGHVDYRENPKRRRKHKKAKRKSRRKKKHVAAANPRRRRRKHKKVHANPRRRRHKKHAMANPASKKRRRKSKKHRRVSYAGHIHRGLKRGQRFKLRNARISGITNPIDADNIKHLVMASVGYLAAYSLFKIVDGIGVTAYNGSNGLISTQINAVIPASVAPFVAPLIVPGLVIGVAYGLHHLPVAKDNAHVRSLANGAIMVAGVMAALGITTAVWTQIKTSANLAALPIIGPAFSGINYTPAAMAGADFGMYPQMGQYQQSPADFGIMPEGLRGINYTPNGMHGVQYYPDQANGGAMYQHSQQGQDAESQGLSGMGIMPENMGDADFGIVPEGMGEDYGQMG